MKNKFSKIGKLTLSLVVAFAVVAVSLFTVVPGINLGANAATVEDTWDGTTTKPTATDADGNIIINTAEELAWVALAGGDETKDQNYKAVAGSVFNMNGMTGITADSTVSNVNDADRNAAYLWVNDSKRFQGNFDGNGLVVYNINSDGVDANGSTNAYGALFPAVRPENTAQSVTIKNVTVAASYFEGYHAAAGIVADVSNQSSNKGCINVENCLVKNCYLSDRQCKIGETCQHNSTSGLMVGTIAHNSSNITNCIAIDNVETTRKIKGGFVGQSSDFIGTQKVVNSIAIGSVPYSSVVEHSTGKVGATVAATTYTGVYTTEAINKSGIATLTAAQMKGAAAMENMPNLDWTKMIAFDGEYPDFRANHTLSIENGDAAGHKIACSDCGKSMTEAHVLVENATGTLQECDVCDYSVAITDKKTVVWDGATKPTTFDESGIAGGGTEDNPYIIKTAAQLWYIAQKAGADSAGKYFKVADNVGTFDMNNKAWGLADNNCYFQGTFDGNGVKIVNFTASGWNIGLFPRVAGNVTIKNVKVDGATVTSSGGDAGAIVGSVAATANVTISGCVVINSEIKGECSAGAIIGTAGAQPLLVENCFVANNTVDADTKNTGTTEYKDNAVIGYGHTSTRTLKNTIVIDNDPNVRVSVAENVYTDQVPTLNGITQLTVDQMTGANALDNLSGFDFVSVWFANNTSTPELQVFHTLKGTADTTDAYAGHTANCKDCGLKGVGLSDHAYNDAYECEVCGFTCDHKNADHITTSAENAGDCVTDPYVEKNCDCGYNWQEKTGTASGHSLTRTAANDPTCAKDGNKEYWTCSVCEKIFLSDDKMAAMDTAVTADDVVLSATGAHVELRDDDGELVYLMDENSHSTYCKVCKTKITTTAHEGEYEKDENGHTGKCKVCEWGTDEKAPHNFGDDSSCDICEWTCTQHIVTDGAVKVEGDCVTDRVTAQYCDRCKISLTDKVENAKGHQLVKTDAVKEDCTKDGNVDYWTCSTCEKIFLTDNTMAAMDTAVSAEDTVVAKTPHNYVGGKPTYKYDESAHWFECEDCGIAEYTEHTLETDTDCEGVYQWCEDADGNSCGYEIFDYSYSSDDGSATVVADTNTFTKDVITDLIQITTETSDYAELEEIFKAAGHTKFAAYDFSPNEEMAEGGKATLTIAIPDIFGNDAAIYYVDTESGKLEKLATVIETVEDEKGNKIAVASAKITKTGVFAVAADEVIVGGDDNADNNINSGNNNQTNSGSVNNNGDTSNTSPATASETVAAVAAVATLSAAAIVLARKFKKS